MLFRFTDDWPMEGQGQGTLHVTSDSSISTQTDDSCPLLVAPIAPPRLKKLQRQADDAITDSTTTTMTSSLALPALPGNEEEEKEVVDGGLMVSNDSLFESLDERNLGDDEVSEEDLHRKSTQSLTSDLADSFW